MSWFKSKSGKAPQPGKKRGEERRQTQQNVAKDRRDPNDRREVKYGVKFSTSGSLASLEDWLEENCTSNWNLVLLDLDDDFDKKVVQVMFANETDKTAFTANFAKLK